MPTDPSDFYVDIPEELTQGDVFRYLPLAYVQPPFQLLTPKMGKGNRPEFSVQLIDLTPDSADHSLALPTDFVNQGGGIAAFGNVGPGVLLTHSCELDKPKRLKLVLIAGIRAINLSSPAEQLANIRDNKDYSKYYLPADSFGVERYVDFDRISTIRMELLREDQRMLSLSPKSTKGLVDALRIFLLHGEG